MLNWLKPVSKAIGGFVSTALVAWFVTMGLDVPADVSTWIATAVETGLIGLAGAVLVYFFPANKTK